jgi:hypothetical protein
MKSKGAPSFDRSDCGLEIPEPWLFEASPGLRMSVLQVRLAGVPVGRHDQKLSVRQCEYNVRTLFRHTSIAALKNVTVYRLWFEKAW